MIEYSAIYYEACEKWVDEVSKIPPSNFLSGLGLGAPALTKADDQRMALTIADMPTYKWDGPPLPLVTKRTHKSQSEQEKAT